MKIGIIGPTENEINPFLKHLTVSNTRKLAKLDFHEGKYSNTDIVALFCGVCKVNAAIAAQILIDVFGVTHIIVVGVAGAIDKDLKILDTVISSEVGYHDVADGILTEYHPWMKSIYFTPDEKLEEKFAYIAQDKKWNSSVLFGKIVTGEAFIDQQGREEIIEKHNPLCVDMETASIAHVCYVNGVPFIAVRSMSDSPAESGAEAFEKYCEAAANKSVEVLIAFLDGLGPEKNIV